MSALLCLVIVLTRKHAFLFTKSHHIVSTEEIPNFTNAEINHFNRRSGEKKVCCIFRTQLNYDKSGEKREWHLTCTKVNSVNSSYYRTADDLKKKMSVLCSDTKKKISNLNEKKEKLMAVIYRLIVL